VAFRLGPGGFPRYTVAVLSAADRTTLDRFASDCADALGDNLDAVVVHGDVVTGDAAGESPLTTVVLVKRMDVAVLRSVASVTRKWRRSRIATPLVLDREHLATSCDVFPLEILTLMDAHVLIRGDRDPFDSLTLDHEHLRLEVEQQLRGKLLHLRQAYVEIRSNAGNLGGLPDIGGKRALRTLMVDSSAGFEAILGAVLLLAGHDRADTASISEEIERSLGLGFPSFRAVQQSRRHGGSLPPGDVETLFESYMDELNALTRLADSISKASRAGHNPS
jgi:hypothetical protein